MSSTTTDFPTPATRTGQVPLAFAAGSALVIGSLCGAILFAALRTDVTAPLIQPIALLHLVLTVSMLTAGHLLASKLAIPPRFAVMAPRTAMYTGAIAATVLLATYMLGAVNAQLLIRTMVPIVCGALVTVAASSCVSRANPRS